VLLKLHFYQLNSDFSQEHADAHHQGEESENNIRYEWEDEFEISQNLKNVTLVRNGIFHLQGQYKNGEVFNEEVPNMLLIQLELTDGMIGELGASESLVIDFKKEDFLEETHISIFLRDDAPFWNEMNGVFIASKDFPKNVQLHDLD